MKPGTIVNATFNGCHCFAQITDTGTKFGETFYSVVLLSPCVMERMTIPEGTKTWVWPEMVTVESDSPGEIKGLPEGDRDPIC